MEELSRESLSRSEVADPGTGTLKISRSASDVPLSRGNHPRNTKI